MPMVLANTNPAFVGLPYLLRKQSIQLEWLALRREVNWFWPGHESTCNCQPPVEQQSLPNQDTPGQQYTDFPPANPLL
jgi:hypothetical protein